MNQFITDNSNFILRNYDKKDYESVKDIPRVPEYFLKSESNIVAISHPLDFSLRPHLTKEHQILVVEDTRNNLVVGSYCMSVKEVRIFGEKKRMYYVFDYSVNPKYRNQRISRIFNQHLDHTMKMQANGNPNDIPYFFASTSKTNEIAKKRMIDVGIIPFFTQRQSSWKLIHPISLPVLPMGLEVHIRLEANPTKIRDHWENSFKNYNFAPFDFSELIDHCSKYLDQTFILQLTKKGSRGDVIAEASITLWNQDLLFALKDPRGKVCLHRQLTCCYSIGNKSYQDLAFQYLLKFVHNESLKRGIEFLFIGLPTLDPVAKHFPLLPGIKSLEYFANFFRSQRLWFNIFLS